MARFLQVAGVLALLAWTGLGAAAWMLVKDRLQITVTDGAEAARDGDDPVQLLSGQVENLQGDVTALSQGIGQSLENLAQLLAEERAAEAAALRTALEAQVAALRSQVEAISGNQARAVAEQSQVRTLLEEWARRPGAAVDPQSVPLAAGEADPLIEGAADPTPASAGDPAGEAVAQAAEDPAVRPASRDAGSDVGSDTSSNAGNNVGSDTGRAAEPAPAPRRRSFLAIQLPSQEFKFDEERTWNIVPSMSRVGFDAKSTLHDFTGVTSKVGGSLTTALASPADGLTAEIEVDASALRTGLDGRDEAMAEHLAVPEHPTITFAAESIEVGAVDPEAQRVEGTVSGTMTIRGVAKTVTMPVVMQVDKSRRLTVEGQTSLKMSDYGVPVPSQLGVISVTDEVQVWINLKLRAKPKEEGK